MVIRNKMRNMIFCIWTIAISEFKSWIRYRMHILNMIIFPTLILLIAYVFQTTAAPGLIDKTTGGASFLPQYILLGLGAHYLSAFVFECSGILMANQTVLALPVKRTVFVIGKVIGYVITTGFVSTLIFIIAVILFGWGNPTKLPLFFGACAISIITYAGLGFSFTALGMRFIGFPKLMNTFNTAVQFLSGVILPVRALPKPLQIVSYLLPFTWSTDMIRITIIDVQPLMPLHYEFLYLIILSIFLNALGFTALKKTEHYVKLMGLTAIR